MHVEAQAILEPIEKSTRFVEIQVDDVMLDAMDEVNRDAKTTLQQFKPTIQTEYILLPYLDSLSETEWNALLDTKPKVHDSNVAQQFFAGASI